LAITVYRLTTWHFAKYCFEGNGNAAVNVVTRRHLTEASEQYPDAAKEIGAWLKIAGAARWRSLVGVREIFQDADAVDGYVVFNFRQNRYRLVTIIHYSREKDGRITEGHIYIRSFLTHKQYDSRANWG